MANGVSRKINLFRSIHTPARPPLETGKTRFQFPQRHGECECECECGPTSQSSVLVGKRVFHSGSATVFWRLADTLASFFLGSSAGTPNFSTCCACADFPHFPAAGSENQGKML